MLAPTMITVFTETGIRTGKISGGRFQHEDLSVSLTVTSDDALAVAVNADSTAVRYLQLHFEWKFSSDTLFCGDAWERAYGDLQWAGCNPSRPMPWYFLASDAERTVGFGVKVRPRGFALWFAERNGATLFLDIRNGDRGIVLAGRTLEVAEVVQSVSIGVKPFAAAQAFCRKMSRGTLQVSEPVYGGNNWYYAYGKSSHAEILADCAELSELTAGLANRPFMVIDDGWEYNYNHSNGQNAGPWNLGNAAFPDMAELAVAMQSKGVKPGIWFRPLWNLSPEIPDEWKNSAGFLDVSHPEALAQIARDIRGMSAWGFKLIKHDFSTKDIFGKWGFQMIGFPAGKGLHFFDCTRTTAEIVMNFYHVILDAAGDSLILGCNTIGHLGAGLMHLARIGDDTSGRCWDRTRKMGVNTLAFRLPQHRAFFDIDADCVGITGEIPWSFNRQWSELLAQSGTPFFASIRPGALDSEAKSLMRRCFAVAAHAESHLEPLDWQTTTTPEHWLIDGKEWYFNWEEPGGRTPEFVLENS